MKKAIRNSINALLTAAIVLLGFGSCHTVKSAADGNQAGQTEENNQKDNNGKNDNSNGSARYVGDDNGHREPQPVVYGPPPGRFDDNRPQIRK